MVHDRVNDSRLCLGRRSVPGRYLTFTFSCILGLLIYDFEVPA